MALQVNGVAAAMERDILHRYELRGIARDLKAAERRKIAATAEQIEGFAPDRAVVVMQVFLDHAFPVGPRSFCPVQNLYFRWREWSAEVYPTIEHVFPITAADEDVLGCLFRDWRALRADKGYYHSVYRRPGAVGGARLEPAYRHTADFTRVLTVLRDYQRAEDAAQYPLFTLRAYLAAQIEALAGFVPTLKVGNIVSEKARQRFDEWYLYRFYNLELVKKGLKRPSGNNPVSNPAIRVEYEGQRAGSGVGDLTFEGETPVPWATRPARSFAAATGDDGVAARATLPPSMGDLLR